MEMILTGNHVKADLALAYGLVNRMVPQGEEDNEAQELLKSILSNGPIAVRKAIQSVYASDLPKEEGYRFEAEAFGHLCGTRDATEGMNAFLEKRDPEFTGK
jgi:enoyl-CoA hydratase/carnithine racemase